jgi:hypothetical protein
MHMHIVRYLAASSALAAASSQEQGAPKKKKEKSDVPTYLPSLRFFKIFRSDFRKYFMVFLGSSCRETAKNAIKEIRREETKGKKFLMVFLNSPC